MSENFEENSDLFFDGEKTCTTSCEPCRGPRPRCPCEELMATRRALIDRKLALQDSNDGAEYAMVIRQIAGIRGSREEAEGIIESLDPFGWGRWPEPRR